MVNNYPEYAAGVNYKKTDSEDVTHFYSAQVVADPSDDTIESKLIKDGVVISEGGGGGSSDFSTVTVDITVNGGDGIYLSNAVGIIDDEMMWLESIETGTVMLVLYKGLYEDTIIPAEGYKLSSATGTGGVTIKNAPIGDFKMVHIIGDGTLTVDITPEN